VVKNQELKATTAIVVSDTASTNRINLKIPIQSLDDLNTIDTNEEKMDALVCYNYLLSLNIV